MCMFVLYIIAVVATSFLKKEKSCKALNKQCEDGAHGLRILRNGCYKGSDGKVKHACAYYTAKDCIDNCLAKAKDTHYVVNFHCKNKVDVFGKRWVEEGPCMLKPTCKTLTANCKKERKGKDILENVCYETRNEHGEIEFVQRCIYLAV